MQIEAVIFDRDNTLLYFDPARQARLEAQIAMVAPAITTERLYAAWASWPGPWPRHPDDEPAFWSAFWERVSAQHNVAPDRLPALRALGAFYHTCFSAFPDALPCLHALRDTGLRLAVLTNFELPSVGLALEHAGISLTLFHALLSGVAIGVSKPDAAAYHAAAAALRAPLAACAFIDDDRANVLAARALGMRAFLLDRSLPVGDLDAHVLQSLDELPAALKGVPLPTA
ncbi:MAG: HAD family hydrolase [Chloroflexales bacterium]|nr:HAD family hydrolase [Chloroflexales bacterium]